MSRSIDSAPGSANQVPEGAINIENDPARSGGSRGALGRATDLVSVRERFDVMTTAWANNRDQAINDDKMVGGDQWDTLIRKEREEEGRPILTYNLLLTFCNQIVNRTRQEWPQIRVRPTQGDTGGARRVENVTGTKDYSMAEVMMGILRNIEHVSRADHAYITSLEHSVQHGFGFFRMQPVYTRDDSFDQELRIFRIKNSYSVLVDPSAQEVDYSDMQDCFIHTMVNKAAFERMWPDARATAFESNEQGNTYEGWYDREKVRIAEYFWIDYEQDSIVQMNDGQVHYKSDVEPILDELKRDRGIHVVRERAVKRPRCKWQKMTASDILEGPVTLPCSHIPVFPVLGRELIIDGETRYHSAIRHAKDAQKAYNYWQTAASESVALAPRAPWVLTGKQIEGWEQEWENANRENQPYLLYNHQDGVPPPQRIFADQGAIAQLQQAGQQHQVMQDIIGMHESNLGAASNERSGVAVRERAARGELSTYGFADNLGRAIEHMGRVALEMIPRIYTGERVMRIRMPDDTEDFVKINETVRDEQTGRDVIRADIAYGKYDVVISTDPSFATQRQEAQQNILETMQRLPPEQAAMISHLLVKHMDFPGADDMARILRKMLPDDFKTPDELEEDLPPGVTLDEETGQPVDAQGQPWQKPPSPQEQIQMEEHKAEQKKHEATIAKAEADLAEAQQKLAELQAGGGEDPQAMAEQIQAGVLGELQGMLSEMLDNAMEAHEANSSAHQELNIEGQITDMAVEVLNRVKKVYDGKIQQMTQEGMPAPNGTDAAPGQGGPMIVTGDIEIPRVDKIVFETDGENLVAAVPQYSNGEDDGE